VGNKKIGGAQSTNVPRSYGAESNINETVLVNTKQVSDLNNEPG